MKIKNTVFAISAAFYAAGIAANVHSTGSNIADNNVTPHAIDMMKLYQIQKESASGQKNEFLSPLRHGDLSNMHFAARKPSDKITIEKNLSGKHVYIVRLIDKPIATFDGEVSGFSATKASSNKNIKLYSAAQPAANEQQNIAVYQQYLLAKQDDFVTQAKKQGVALDIREHFTTALNAVTVELTQQEALQLTQMSEVAYVQRSKTYQLHTDVGPEHIGAGGVWDGSATLDNSQYKGEGMIIGMIDTGINTDHPSFAAVDGDGYHHINPLGTGNYLGGCKLEEFADRCNDKLIGVYTHPTVTETFFSTPENSWEEPVRLAPDFGEDYNGHGSHTASTVAGNVQYDVDDLLPDLVGDGHGQPIGVKMPRVSGVAPRANIIAYQVCMPTGGCGGEAILFAIDQAIKDGVDVINMSIGGGENFPWDDATEMAFLSAREAGIAVSLSAGNSGSSRGKDSTYTVDHTSPWVLNVAATTHARSINIQGKALNNFSGGDSDLIPLELTGAGISDAFTGELILAADYGDARCNAPFAAGTFTSNQIVICERGDIARWDKAVNVQAGGGGAFILYNTSAEGDQVNDDPYVIPGIHLTYNQWNGPSWKIKALKPWLASGSGLTATITASQVSRDINAADADWLAPFSSRGPSSTVTELFSPGIAAPGVDIFAAWTEENPFAEISDTRDWNRISGTSMASPHVAGAMVLVRQAHPGWTATQIQSALQMTADSKVIKMKHPFYRDENGDPEVLVAGPYRAGHGLVNVARAIDAGLIMDESAKNFRRANPHNGGRVRDLNLPQLINRDCGRQCSWTRTITATTAGSWHVNVEKVQQNQLDFEWTLDPTAKTVVSPSHFSLKAGESITLTITSNFEDVDLAWFEGAVHADQGEIQFIAEDTTTPIAIWPYSAAYTGKTLPDTVNISATDDSASAYVENIPFGVPTASLKAVAYEPVELTSQHLVIPRMGFGVQSINNSGYFNTIDDPDLGIVENNFIKTIKVDVPENSAVFRVELGAIVDTTSNNELGTNSYINGDLYLVRDFNHDGRFHYTEAICASTLEQTTEGEFCSIENPEAGEYTIIIVNGILYPFDSIDTFNVRYGVVSKDVSTDFNIDFKQSTGVELMADMTIHWDKTLAENSVYHSAIAIQAGDNREGSLTLVPLKIMRGPNTLTINSSQTHALVGDVIDMNLVIQANKSGVDRLINLKALLPEGLTIVAGSFKEVEGITLTDDGFAINVTQVNSADWKTNYNISTNETDTMCRTPWEQYLPETAGQYVNLRNYGIQPSWGSFFEVNQWGWGNWVHELTIPVLTNTGHELTPFDNENYFKTDQIVLSSRGWVQMDVGNFNPYDIVPQQMHLELPSTGYSTPPDYLFAPWWNAALDQNWNRSTTLAKYKLERFNAEQESGVSLAYLGNYMLLEWDNAKTYDEGFDENWNKILTARDDSYDHQMFLRSNTSYVSNQYEVIMAYDNINFGSQTGSGSIGLRGYHGPRAGFNPLNGHRGVALAYNNLKDVIKDGLVVCYDIVGPESTRITVNFKARVTQAAIASMQTINVTGNINGITNSQAQIDIDVASNITMTPIADHEIDENTTLDGIRVDFSDADGGISANDIIISGEHISGEVSGNTSGSTLTITPEANWHGDTEVTVSVVDKVFANDKASTSFILTVNSDGIEFGCTNSAASNYDANANTDDGSCKIPAKDGSAKSSSGGSFGIFVILFMLLIMLRRKGYSLT